MEQLGADVMVGPLSGDESVAVANYAKPHPTKTFVIGTAGAQDPTLQIAPKNLFRFHGDGAQWNAGLGEIVYKKLGWRTAAMVMDDYSFAWTSAAGIIAEFCAIGGKITKRVFPPLNTTDYSSYVRQMPPPDRWTETSGSSAERAPGLRSRRSSRRTARIKPSSIGEPFSGSSGLPGRRTALVGSYVGGSAPAGPRDARRRRRTDAIAKKTYPGFADANVEDGSSTTTINPRGAGQGPAGGPKGDIGGRLRRRSRRRLGTVPASRTGGTSSWTRTGRRSRTSAAADRKGQRQLAVKTAGYIPNVDQTFGGFFEKSARRRGGTARRA